MRKGNEADERIRAMLKKDNYQDVLDKLVKASDYKEGELSRSGIISAIAPEVFSGKKDSVRRTISAVEELSKPGNEVIESYLRENKIKITKNSLKYASRR